MLLTSVILAKITYLSITKWWYSLLVKMKIQIIMLKTKSVISNKTKSALADPKIPLLAINSSYTTPSHAGNETIFIIILL